MRAILISFLLAAACSRPAPPPPPPGTIEVLDERDRLSMSMVPVEGGYALVDFNGRTFGTLKTGKEATAYDMNGAALAKLDGDKIVDVEGKLLLHVKDGKVIGPDGHLRYEIEGAELLREGVPVIAPIKVRNAPSALLARCLSLTEEPLDVRLVLAAAHM